MWLVDAVLSFDGRTDAGMVPSGLIETMGRTMNLAPQKQGKVIKGDPSQLQTWDDPLLTTSVLLMGGSSWRAMTRARLARNSRWTEGR